MINQNSWLQVVTDLAATNNTIIHNQKIHAESNIAIQETTLLLIEFLEELETEKITNYGKV